MRIKAINQKNLKIKQEKFGDVNRLAKNNMRTIPLRYSFRTTVQDIKNKESLLTIHNMKETENTFPVLYAALTKTLEELSLNDT